MLYQSGKQSYSIFFIFSRTPKTRLPTTFCVEKTKTCRDITHVIDSRAILQGNHTDIVSLTLIQHNPRSVQNASENMFDIFNIFLNVDLKGKTVKCD